MTKQTLVLLHGWGMNQGVWQGVIPALSEHFHVLPLDLPGFGALHDLTDHQSLEAMTNIIAKDIPDQSLLLGWSLGGLVAIHLAATYPEKVCQLLLVASSPKFVHCESWPGIKPEILQNFGLQLSQDIPKTIERFLKIQAMGSPTLRNDIRELKADIEQYPYPTQETLAATLTLLSNTDLRQTLAGLNAPIQLFLGKLDTLVPVTNLENIQALNPHLRAHVFEKASHAPFISHPIEFVEALAQLA
ncbi:pimeloyl-ACP methyl ester esterase BioH [Algicola sagamiensis]|uniref:pimeloyl-ACP methyl ester esterase BioH n=1 Tax=Algicola sagamiensis TaxID=163869 RepID=UPI000378755B|nr:pimeloyl-ACP methyl ester esterase BioH [Algicola sagamiensis]